MGFAEKVEAGKAKYAAKIATMPANYAGSASRAQSHYRESGIGGKMLANYERAWTYMAGNYAKAITPGLENKWAARLLEASR